MFSEETTIKGIAIFIVVLALSFSQDVTNRDFFYLLVFFGVISFSQQKYAKCIIR